VETIIEEDEKRKRRGRRERGVVYGMVVWMQATRNHAYFLVLRLWGSADVGLGGGVQ
jgi:hypothetical protein